MSHLDLPLRLTSTGALATVEADSAADIANSLGVLAATRPGERLSVPGYGTPDPLLGGFDENALQAAASVWEPRAQTSSLTVSRNPDGSLDVAVTLEA